MHGLFLIVTSHGGDKELWCHTSPILEALETSEGPTPKPGVRTSTYARERGRRLVHHVQGPAVLIGQGLVCYVHFWKPALEKHCRKTEVFSTENKMMEGSAYTIGQIVKDVSVSNENTLEAILF